MRMIEADKLEKAMEDAGVLSRDLLEPGPQFPSAWGVPIVDAEPVTRCKDCDRATISDLTVVTRYDCPLHDSPCLSPEFFCAYGKPKQPDALDKFEQAIQYLRELWSEHCLNLRREKDEH